MNEFCRVKDDLLENPLSALPNQPIAKRRIMQISQAKQPPNCRETFPIPWGKSIWNLN